MKDIYADINKVIEKVIELRIKEISDKTNLGDKLLIINNEIKKESKTRVKAKSVKKKIPDDQKILKNYTTFIKDAKGIINDKLNLNYLSNDNILKIKSLKNKNCESFVLKIFLSSNTGCFTNFAR